jgi:hypothetical protein
MSAVQECVFETQNAGVGRYQIRDTRAVVVEAEVVGVNEISLVAALGCHHKMDSVKQLNVGDWQEMRRRVVLVTRAPPEAADPSGRHDRPVRDLRKTENDKLPLIVAFSPHHAKGVRTSAS